MALNNTHFGREVIAKMLCGVSSVYFIGVGGINMSSLALATQKTGRTVGGSDRTRTALTESLEQSGVKLFYCHDAKNIEGYEAVVYTVAISEDNPEYQAARERGLPLISRADYLGYLMSGYTHRIGVSGMHGKSTVTAMLASIFLGAERSPTVMCGAAVGCMGGAYTIGDGDEFIFEACEYMDSFLDFYPNISVILNVEEEHLDYFSGIDHIRRSFLSFSDIASADGGFAVINADDENCEYIAKSTKASVLTFGLSEAADVRACSVESRRGFCSFDVFVKGSFYCHLDLAIAGRFNVYNALAASAVAYLRGIDGNEVALALRHFTGAERRMEKKGSLHGAEVYSDYAHHPTEIRATLSSAKEMTDGRVFCVFQPHTYSRLKAFFDDTAEALSLADRVITVKVYAARETDTLGVDSELLARAVGKKGEFLAEYADAVARLVSEAKKGDTVIVMGAGSIVSMLDLIPFDASVGEE